MCWLKLSQHNLQSAKPKIFHNGLPGIGHSPGFAVPSAKWKQQKFSQALVYILLNHADEPYSSYTCSG